MSSFNAYIFTNIKHHINPIFILSPFLNFLHFLLLFYLSIFPSFYFLFYFYMGVIFICCFSRMLAYSCGWPSFLLLQGNAFPVILNKLPYTLYIFHQTCSATPHKSTKLSHICTNCWIKTNQTSTSSNRVHR